MWWLTIAVSFNLAIFLTLPKIASFFVERQFEAFGLKNVNVELEYPGLQQTLIPSISFQKEMGSETASLTIRDLTLNYDLPQLLEGFMKEIRIEELHFDMTGVPIEESQPRVTQSSENRVAAPLALFSKPLPTLPFGLFSLTKATIFREHATGPLRRVTVSSQLHNTEGMLNGTVTFQGIQGEAYTLQVNINPRGKMKIVLDSQQDHTNPLMDLESAMTVSKNSGIQWEGTMTANLQRAAPFLALLMPLGPDLERVNGMVNFQWDGSSKHLDSLQGMMQDPSSQLHGVIQAQVELPTWGKVSDNISINLSGTVDANASEVQLALAPTTSMMVNLHPLEFPLKDQLPFLNLREKEPVHIQLNDIVRSRISFDKEDPRWNIDGPLHIRYGEEESPIGMDVVFTNAAGQLLNPLSTQASATFSLWGSLPHFQHQDSEAHDISWNLKGQIGLENQIIQVSFAKGSSVKTGTIKADQGHADQFAFLFDQPVPLTYDWPLHQLMVGTTSAQIQLSTVHWRDQSFSISKIALDLQEATGDEHTWNSKGTVKLLGVSTAMKGFNPPSLNLAIGFDANPDTLHAGIVAETTDKTIRAKGRLAHHFQTNQGTLQATLNPEKFSPSTMTLSRWIQPWKHPFDITSGHIGISLDCAWKAITSSESPTMTLARGDVTVALTHIGGYYENVLIDDVNSTMTITANAIDNFATLSPATVTIGSVNTGIEVTDTTFDITLRLGKGDSLPTVDIEKFSTHLLGGQVSSASIYVDMARLPSLFTVKLDGLQLDQLLQLEQQKGLEGSGTLDGVVPITLNPTAVEIHDGLIEARPPGGVIHFEPEEGTAQTLRKANPQMDIVLQSLRNFHYDVLKAEVNYDADGTLTLATKLEGKSPDLKEGRPIHFNLNVEENIPTLLKTLRVIKGIEDKIERLFQGPLF
ncbi:MAG: YdbH domain-containing protein [Nitrospirae bacterium]|nr:YdbH domain-containing protein [Nitrospirota bacterium]